MDLHIDQLRPATHLDVLSFGRSQDRLVPSVKRSGIITPPVVSRDSDGKLCLVTGKARVDALRSLGRKTVCAFLRDDLDRQSAFELALEENVLTRGLNTVERADGARYVLEVLAPPRQTEVRLLTLLDVPRNPRSLTHHLDLSRAPENVRSMVVGGMLTFHAFVLLKRLDEADREALLTVIERLRLGHNYQRQLITLSCDLAAGRGAQVARVLSEPGLQGVIEDGNISVPDRVKRLFTILRRQRSESAVSVTERGVETQ